MAGDDGISVPDSGTSVRDLDKLGKMKKTKLTIINTNARSLCPKIESLLDCFEEL